MMLNGTILMIEELKNGYESSEYGTMNVKYRVHVRNYYTTGGYKRILVPIFSAELPNGSRKRLQNVYQNIYRMNTEDGNVTYIDIDSGNSISDMVVIIDGSAYGEDDIEFKPLDKDIVTSRLAQDLIYGFADINCNGDIYRIFYMDKGKTTGYALCRDGKSYSVRFL